MCGIVGILSKEDVVERLLDGLKRLEYRGYDSAGIATIVNEKMQNRRAVGKLANLISLCDQDTIVGNIGIGHTRWATHGSAITDNAHPHANDDVAIVHNGIIENFSELKHKLIEKGHTFQSETDTEVVLHLITDYLKNGFDELSAIRQTLGHLEGAFALVMMFKKKPDQLFVTRKGSPLVIGLDENSGYVGSDAIALAPWTNEIIYLEEGDLAQLTLNETLSYQIFDENAAPAQRRVQKTNINIDAVSKGNFNHYMLKEIYEQPKALAETIHSLIDIEDKKFRDAVAAIDWKHVKKIQIIACGTSYYAGMVAKYWFESLAKISVDVDIASEFRYRTPVLEHIDLCIGISQSGETIDTLSALKLVRGASKKTLGILNVSESSIGRLVDYVIPTQAGPEIGVASTKAFTAQLTVLVSLALAAGMGNKNLDADEANRLFDALIKLPGEFAKNLNHDDKIQSICDSLVEAKGVLYLGRGTNFPIALEGALKLKEISYIHAEGYAAGELKHGPIALIDRHMPVVVIAPHDQWFEKTLSNVQEVVARGARVIVFTDHLGFAKFTQQGLKNSEIISLGDEMCAALSPIYYTLPIQLLAYYVAFFKGTDVDQPRNLAKSVTVE